MDASSSKLSISLFLWCLWKPSLRGYSLYSSGLSGYQFGRTKEITLVLVPSEKSHGNPTYDVINVTQQPRRRIRANPCVFSFSLFYFFFLFLFFLRRLVACLSTEYASIRVRRANMASLSNAKPFLIRIVSLTFRFHSSWIPITTILNISSIRTNSIPNDSWSTVKEINNFDASIQSYSNWDLL